MSMMSTTATLFHWSMSMGMMNSTYCQAENTLRHTGCMWFQSHKCCNWGDNSCRGTQTWRRCRCIPSYISRSDSEVGGCRRCSKICLRACMIGNRSNSLVQVQEKTQIWKSFRWANHLENFRAWNIYLSKCKRYYLSLN